MQKINDDQLWEALDRSYDRHVFLAAPGWPSDIPGETRTTPMHWIACSNGRVNPLWAEHMRDQARTSLCRNVFPVYSMVVSAMCDECSAPCVEPSCGLLVYQHGPTGAHELRVVEDCGPPTICGFLKGHGGACTPKVSA